MTPSQIFAAITPETAADILQFNHDHEREAYKAAVAAVAQARKVRPVFLERQPRPERHAAMRSTLSRPDLRFVADNLVRSWLLKRHTPLLASFLDSLQIPHEAGVVGDLPAVIDDAALLQAVETLLAHYPGELVGLYLHAFNEMNETRWPNLDLLLERDPRLALGRAPESREPA